MGIISVQLCPTLCDPKDCSTPGFPVHHQLNEQYEKGIIWIRLNLIYYLSNLVSCYMFITTMLCLLSFLKCLRMSLDHFFHILVISFLLACKDLYGLPWWLRDDWPADLRMPGNTAEAGLILGSERLLEEGRATHSSILSWRIPWTEDPGRL